MADWRHAHQGWPNGKCSYRLTRRAGAGPCNLPRSAPIHLSYPCPICGDVRWSVEARLIHIEAAHPLTRKVWERA